MKFRKPDELPDTGGKNFVRLKDGESVTGILVGELHEFFMRWEGGKGREVPEGTPGATFRFRVNIIVKEGTTYVPKIFEQGITVYRQLAELNSIYPLEKTVIRISRSGSSVNDTTYSVLPLPTPVAPETLAHIATLKLHDLSDAGGSQKGSDTKAPKDSESFGPEPNFHDDNDLPF